MLPVCHEKTTKCECLGGREEQTCGHVSHWMSRKMRCFVNCVEKLSPVIRTKLLLFVF